MNILYLCADTGIPVRGYKGASVHVRAIINAFAELGHQVTLLTPRVGKDDSVPIAARIVEVPTLLGLTSDSSDERREQMAREVAESIFQTGLGLLGQEKFDFLYERYSLWSVAGARLSRANRLPLIVEVNAPLRVEAARYRTLTGRSEAGEIERDLFEQATAISVVSCGLREYVLRQGAEANRVKVLPNGVDDRLFHPGVIGRAVRSDLGLSERFVIGFAGTARPWHDLDTLLAAFELLHATGSGPRPYHLLLLGDFPETLHATVAQRGIADAVTFVGPVPHPEVPGFLAAMDVAVSPHPALEDFYFSPIKLMEYMACGIATVASNHLSIRQVAEDGVTALLYPPGDAASLAGCITRLAADDRLRAQVGWRAASHVLQKHTWKHNAEEITNWIASTVAEEQGKKTPLFDDKLGCYLFRATRADIAGPLLIAHLDGTWGQVDTLNVLKYKPHRRCVIEYELTINGKRKSVIGKVFKDERGENQFALQEELWLNGIRLDSPDGLTIAKPLAYIPEMRMLVQERAPGVSLDQFVDKPDFLERVRASAHLIAQLHANHLIQPVKQYTLKDEMAQLDRWGAELAARHPEHAYAFTRQLGWLREHAAGLSRANLALAHRDFYYAQVMFDDGRATLIDLDMVSRADPAIDVANFAVHLCFLALQRFSNHQALDAAAALFIQEYAKDCAQRRGSVSRILQPEFGERLDFYTVATWFRLMHVVLERPLLTRYFESLFRINGEIVNARSKPLLFQSPLTL